MQLLNGTSQLNFSMVVSRWQPLHAASRWQSLSNSHSVAASSLSILSKPVNVYFLQFRRLYRRPSKTLRKVQVANQWRIWDFEYPMDAACSIQASLRHLFWSPKLKHLLWSIFVERSSLMHPFRTSLLMCLPWCMSNREDDAFLPSPKESLLSRKKGF